MFIDSRHPRIGGRATTGDNHPPPSLAESRGNPHELWTTRLSAQPRTSANRL